MHPSKLQVLGALAFVGILPQESPEEGQKGMMK